MKRDYIKELNNLNDWYACKASVNKTYFEVYLKSNNGKMVAYIISPTCRYYPLWRLFISNSDGFDGEWSNSPIQMTFRTFVGLKDHINWINTNKNWNLMKRVE